MTRSTDTAPLIFAPTVTASSPPFVAVFRVVVAPIAIAFAVGCASLHPPIDAPADISPDELRVELLRGDPDGLHIALHAADAAAGDEVEIWRRREGEPWHHRQTIAIDDALVAPLQTGDVQWRDPLSSESASLQYRLRHVGDDRQRLSEPVELLWFGWPEPPQSNAEADDDARVVVSWDIEIDADVRIQRRDVLADGEFRPVAIVDAAAGGRFEDPDVEAGGVYAYRLQTVDRRGAVPRFSGPSPEVYVSVPE